MTSNDVDYIHHKNIKNFTVDVTGEISSKNLKEFIKTSIEIELQENIFEYQVFVSFIQKANKYEIYLYHSPYKLLILPEIFYKKVTKDDTTQYQLYICKDFFVVYLNNSFYFYKNNDNYKYEDILSYISFFYKIDSNEINVYEVSQKEFEILKIEYLDGKKESKLNYIDFSSNNSYKYYLLYLFSIILSVALYFAMGQNTKEVYVSDDTSALKNIKSKYYKALANKYKYKELKTNALIGIFDDLKMYNLTLLSCSYKEICLLRIKSKDKKDLYKFVNLHKEKIKIKSIVSQEKIYIMEIEFEL
ncbi:MAG TPA: hypothetical protein EYG97_03715 [Arcobacter sp.]|nr:hypothetical protein [Arcobacter sp.]HIP56110.1 hypothetical protein [Arcobacter sp.]